jgi:hypothetical protein
MMGSYTDGFLRRLRNEIDIDQVIKTLALETRSSTKYRRFRCPSCHDFHTATNPKTNLARCFDCKINFNPIDLVMAVTAKSFVETVEYLKTHLADSQTG